MNILTTEGGTVITNVRRKRARCAGARLVEIQEREKALELAISFFDGLQPTVRRHGDSDEMYAAGRGYPHSEMKRHPGDVIDEQS